jgi:hypothetical protein
MQSAGGGVEICLRKVIIQAQQKKEKGTSDLPENTGRNNVPADYFLWRNL